MADFRNYACWTTQGAAALPVEAVQLSQAFFFATHAPLTIYRASNMGVRSESGVDPIGEQAVYAELTTMAARGGTLLLPVIGESGTGKSHLVRWVHEKLQSQPSDRWQVIYLPKQQTSLRGVVKALLAEVDTPELDRLRDRVDQAATRLDQSGLQERLLNQLQEACVAAEPKPGKAKILSGPKGLGVLLQDPYVREYLMRPDAFVPRLAASLLADRREGEEDRKPDFTLDDLPLNVADVTKAAVPTQRLYQHLIADTGLQEAAVDMLKEHLPGAVLEASDIGVGRLQEAMLEVRREFQRQGKQIILLIEDFAVIQGVQGDLLDALIQVGDIGGRQEYATIRTLMAVTTGYYRSLPETVHTRVPHVYDLDVQFNPDSAGMDGMASFVGRYLNAARVGRDALDEHWMRDKSTVPNACETCAFRDACHADDAFGESPEGYGLYPFNRAMLRIAVRARKAPGDLDSAFNPRLVIDKVVRNLLLKYRESLIEDQFPDEAFREEYRPRRPGEDGYVAGVRETAISSEVQYEIESRLGKSAGLRYATLLNFWGAADNERVDTLAPAIYEAFGLRAEDLAGIIAPTLTEGRTASRRESSTTAKRGSEPPPSATPEAPPGLPPAFDRKLKAVDAWSQQGQELSSDVARELRTIIRNSVFQRATWTDPMIPERPFGQLDDVWPARATVVSIDGAYGNKQATPDTPIQFRRDVKNAVFFKGLLLAAEGVLATPTPSWARTSEVTSASQAMWRLARVSEMHQAKLVEKVLSDEDLTEEQLALGIRASLIGATLAGQALPGMREAELLAVVFDGGTTWVRADASIRAPKWADHLQRHLAARPALVGKLQAGLGVSRGSGGVRMIDATRALPMLRAAVQAWTWETPPPAAPARWVGDAVAGFADWESLIRVQVTELEGRLARVRAHLPKGTPLGDTIDAVRRAITHAGTAGIDPVPTGQRGQRQAQLDSLAGRDPNTVQSLERDLTLARDGSDPARQWMAAIYAAARDRGPDISAISAFLAYSAQWLAQSVELGKQQGGGTGQVAADAVRALQQEWSAITREEQS